MSTFNIAIKNPETGIFKFKLDSGGKNPENFQSLESAIREYEIQLMYNGQYDVMIFKRVHLNIDVKITKKEI